MSQPADLPQPPPLAACGYTHPGCKRDDNEDAFGCYADERLFVVADGIGGRSAGEVASRMAVDELERFFRSYHADPRQSWPFPVDRKLSLGANLLRVGIQVANREIRSAAAANPNRHRMGSTLVSLAVGDSQLAICHVGDDWAADIVGAKRAGWRAAYLAVRPEDSPLPGSERDGEVEADLELTSLEGLEAGLAALDA